MKWKSIFKKQAVILLIVGAVVFSPGASASAGSGQSVSGNPSSAAPVKVTGKVTDANGNAVPGVTVMVKGTTTGTVTDADGQFAIDAPDNKAVLAFSFVGYTTIEQPANQKVVNVVLREDIKRLEDVVVIGYGTQKKADLTGSVATVSPEKLNQGVTQSVAHALQGQAAGVTVIQNSGEPGGGVEIRIRGAGSINDNSPLYVVDGIVGGIGGLNPADIESMSVLKDAASAAIYGSRGANGVIIVTTKKGKRNQKTSVSFNTSQGIQSVWKMPTSLDAAQRNIIHKEALTNDNAPSDDTRWAYYNDPQNAVTRTDWFKEVLKPAYISSQDFSVQGGSEKSSYLLSLGYLDNNGIVMNTNYKRYNVRFNSQHEIAKDLTFGENFSVIMTDQKGADTRGGYDGVLSSALFNMRNTPVWADQANLLYGTPTGDFPNPVASLNVKDNRNKGTSIGGNMYLEYKILKVLTLKTDIGYSAGYSHGKSFQAIAKGGGRGLMNKNSLSEGYSNYRQWEWNNTLAFDKRIDKHHFAALAGASMESDGSDYINSGTVQDFSDESPSLRYINNATSFPNHVSGSAGDNALLSYFGRVSYEFSDKYLLAANFRADGSSKFAEDKRWGTFPSVSGGWRISKENFFSGLTNTVSDLKLRASWGQLGNDKIPGYQYYSTIGSVGSPTLNGSAFTAVAQNRYANPSIQWEVTTQTDFGIDANFLNDRLTFTADYFDKQTTDVLVQVPLVLSLGVGQAPFRNAGQVSNKGFDLGLTYRNRDHEFKYAITANLAHVKNEFKTFGVAGDKEIFAANYKNVNVGRIAEGQAIGHFYVLNALGLFQSQSEVDNYKKDGNKIQPNAVAGDVKFEDRDGDGQISSNDRFNAGNSFPTLTYSLNLTAEYKGFDMSMMWIGSQGNKIFNGLKLGGTFLQGESYNSSPEILDRWTPSNTNTLIPRATFRDLNNNKNYSTLYLEDGSYARLKYFTIGYTFDKKITGEKIQKLRLFVTAQNLITITNYTGFDPEVGSYGDFSNNMYGVDTGNYPQPRTFMLGLNFNF